MDGATSKATVDGHIKLESFAASLRATCVCCLCSRRKKEIKACAVADLRVNFFVIHHESPAAAPTSVSLQAISDKEERGCLLICVKKKLPLPAFILQKGRSGAGGKNKAILDLQTSTLGKVWGQKQYACASFIPRTKASLCQKMDILLFKVSACWLHSSCDCIAGVQRWHEQPIIECVLK